MLVVNKPAGYTVHPTRGHKSGTMANGVAKYMLDTGQSFKIRFINRLDMETSGVLLLGKNQLSQGELMKQMKADTVTKLYRAIVHGIPASSSPSRPFPGQTKTMRWQRPFPWSSWILRPAARTRSASTWRTSDARSQATASMARS